MRPIQEHPGQYWKTDDEAALWFDQAGPEPPQTIRCYNMQDHLNSGEACQVPVSCLEFLAAGIFGEARLCWADSRTRWTGESYRYGVYCNPSGLYKNGIVILERHGGGMFGYVFDSSTAGETWGHIASTFPPEMVWNLCHQIARGYNAARDAERCNLLRAFAEGRVKERRANNRIHVEIAGPLLSLTS